ncbi:MAG: hypothetical protein ACTH5W_01080 [Providencia sp.]|uniref:hypothetical protein n=1 Tax=Providencia sp. TaxID=589 RepID=UPI003F959A78
MIMIVIFFFLCQDMGQCDKSYSVINGVLIEQNTPTMWLVTLHKNLFIDFPSRIFISLFGFGFAFLFPDLFIHFFQ